MCGAVMQRTAATLHYSWPRSLKNKMNELRIYAEANFEGREPCTMVFTETWLHQDSFSVLEGFSHIRADRSVMPGKNKGRSSLQH